MSTRSIIALPKDGGGFTGRYCHWDGYPTRRGRQIFEAYHELGGLDLLVKYAIRPDERGYWSSFLTPAEQVEVEALPETEECWLCHGTGARTDDIGRQYGYHLPGKCNGCNGTGETPNRDRPDGWNGHEDDELLDETDDAGAEWVYVLRPEGLQILSAVRENGRKAIGMFGAIGEVDWEIWGEVPWDSEPDETTWRRIEIGG